MTEFIQANVDAYVWGYLVSLVLGGVAVDLIMRLIRRNAKEIPEGKRKKKDVHLVQILGGLERALYTTSIVIGEPGWVPAWLAIKVLTRWNEEHRGANISEANVYLIGNLLTVVFGASGGLLIVHLRIKGP